MSRRLAQAGLPEMVEVGVIGETNLGLLTLVSLWRTVVLLQSAGPKDFETTAYRKKLLLHVLLLLGTAVDLPMYVSFIVTGDYAVATYAFHKLEVAFIFTAYSMTITDWSAVLYEINEDSHVPFLLKRGIVWTIALAVVIIAILNFIYCLAMNNLTTYTETPIYIMGLIVQMCASLTLTCVMLHGGIKLAWRIRGASGHSGGGGSTFPILSLVAYCGDLATSALSCFGLCSRNGGGNLGSDRGDAATSPAQLLINAEESDGGARITSVTNSPFKTSNISAVTAASAGAGAGAGAGAASASPQRARPEPAADSAAMPDPDSAGQGRSQDFLSALRCLNLVMGTCASCELCQMTLLFFNWVLGYAGSQNTTVGPTFFYWTFYAWVPLWGVVLSLLYLSAARSSSSLRKRGSAGGEYAPTQDLTRRLIDDDEAEHSRGPEAASDMGKRGAAARLIGGVRQSEADQSDVASSPGTSFNSTTYSYTYRGQSTSVSQLASDVFFRDVSHGGGHA